MLAAVLSDIHSNVFALQAVLRDVELARASEIWVCGDTFGYYPWAADTFDLLREQQPVAVLGNHDAWVVGAQPIPAHAIGEIAQRNTDDLASNCPAALEWLTTLRPVRDFERSGWKITMVHGTPEDPLDGRYYPDDDRPYSWLPREGQIMVLGQTHYPLLRGDARRGLLLNPGSVGQPRDRNPMPSWALLDVTAGAAELRRTAYDNIRAMACLRALGWDDRITRALDKK
jgi:predicted phosphodiesterase